MLYFEFVVQLATKCSTRSILVSCKTITVTDSHVRSIFLITISGRWQESLSAMKSSSWIKGVAAANVGVSE